MNKVDLLIRTDLEAAEFEDFVHSIWADALLSDECRAILESQGSSGLEITETEKPTVTATQQGIDPGFTVLLLSIATPLAGKTVGAVERAVRDLWEQVLLPRIIRQFGVDRAERIEP